MSFLVTIFFLNTLHPADVGEEKNKMEMKAHTRIDNTVRATERATTMR